MIEEKRRQVHNVIAWLALMLAVMIHVVDEALTGFLPFYNGRVSYLNEHLGFAPLPTFTFGLWISCLAVAIAVGVAFSFFVYRGSKVFRYATFIVGLLMILNACGHMLGSIYYARLLPGFWSSPLLLIAAGFVVTRALYAGNWQD